jgi:hypothetical protein
MITVAAALEPLYTVAHECDYKLTYVYTNVDYQDDPMLKTRVNQFIPDSTFKRCEYATGPAAHNNINIS